MPNLSSTLSPLYRRLQKHTRWQWGNEQQQAFVEAKKQLTSDSLLVHYNPDKSLILTCDASPYGLGAVLSHKMEDGQERPVTYASRSLAPAEKHYSQIEKEGLAIIFGVNVSINISLVTSLQSYQTTNLCKSYSKKPVHWHQLVSNAEP